LNKNSLLRIDSKSAKEILQKDVKDLVSKQIILPDGKQFYLLSILKLNLSNEKAIPYLIFLQKSSCKERVTKTLCCRKQNEFSPKQSNRQGKAIQEADDSQVIPTIIFTSLDKWYPSPDDTFDICPHSLPPHSSNDHISFHLTNYPHEPLLFYLRDYELYYTAFCGPQYNEYAIFIDYQEWLVNKEISFYQYLKIIKAYRALLQDINNHPILLIMPTRFIQTFKYYHQHFEYWTAFEPHIFRFVSKIFPDIHICSFDQTHSHVLIPLRYGINFDSSCLIHTTNGLQCKYPLEMEQLSTK